jgi:hypothetical protein
MPIVEADIKLKLSIKTGTAGNQSAQSNKNESLGKYISTTEVSLAAALNNLFDDVSAAENVAITTDYRCVFVHNSHATLTLTDCVVYLSSGDPAGGVIITIAVDNIAASAVGSASAQAAQIATETTAPTGVGTFSAPTTEPTGLSLGNLTAGQVRAVWVKRVTQNTSTASTPETVSLSIAGETS